MWSVNVNFNLYVLVIGRCSCLDFVKYVSEIFVGIVLSLKVMVCFVGLGLGKYILERNYVFYDFLI